ncbi:MAG: insulinase family protein [Muribaculaceae bacterium]|nr:insulinase family protein [Muribaculaceae bacterium]
MQPIHRFTLDNGLRVVHMHDTRTAMVAVDVMYDVGARDESRELTGMAHLFEHLMFGGSANEPDFNGALERAGGVNNAWTSPDFTNFYELLPAQNIETALRVESDRMLALSFRPEVLEVQRSVVIEEFKETVLNRPYGRAMHELRDMLYKPAHPYSWPVIGLEPAHIERVTDADVRAWFYSHYAPNNAVLAVVGNVGPERVRELVEKWFGDIPRRAVPERTIPADAYHTARDTGMWREIDDRVPSPLVLLAWPMAPYGAEGYTEADIITDILSAGRASRLRRNVMARHPELMAEADASIIGSEHDGMLLMDCRVVDNSRESIVRARECLLSEAFALTVPANITRHELDRAINRFEARQAVEGLSAVEMARRLATAEIHGENLDDELVRRRKVTIESVAETARKIFLRSDGATLIIKPES